MARELSPEIDDELFNEVYGKEYTGPPRVTGSNTAVKVSNKRPSADVQSDEEDGTPDPNAVPTDFTSREAKVWEAKAKATERNWKRRKEEEMICKLCGESGHFTQGCPSTLGASRKSADFFERVPARDKNVRALFSENVISQIEKEIGCKIRMDEKFLFVSGKDRLILAKGVDAVHKVIQEGDKDKKKGSTPPPRSRSRSPRSRSSDLNSAGSHLRRPDSQRSYPSPRRPDSQRQYPSPRWPDSQRSYPSPRRSDSQRSYPSPRRSDSQRSYPSPRRSDSQRSYPSPRRSDSQRSFPSPRNTSHTPARNFNQDRLVEDCVHKDLQKLRGSPHAYTNDGAKERSGRSKSPFHSSYGGDSFGSYDVQNHNAGVHAADGWNVEGHGTDVHSEHKYNYPSYLQTVELEMEFKREAAELGRTRDEEEDEENLKHRECIRELREGYMKRIAMMRSLHAKQWEEFLQLDLQRRQQALHSAFNQSGYLEYNQLAQNRHYMGSNLPMDSRSRYPYPGDNYSASRPRDGYNDFQHQRHNDYGNTYGRY